MLKNTAYLFTIMKDLITFVPSYFYKSVFGIIIISFVIKFFRHKRKKSSRLNPETQR